jgi:hypothetical protein
LDVVDLLKPQQLSDVDKVSADADSIFRATFALQSISPMKREVRHRSRRILFSE